ncbi:ABC transporter permease [Allocoleopsis sp.]|uniref:ABC transporter permease n=1 Tax=Allocoleopsis sp. TaxID=3088169 RepID=UPI002FD5F7FB
MKKIWTQVVKELAQFRRDRLTLSLAFLLPLMTLIIFGFAIRLEAKNIPLVVQDFDNTPLSRAYTERLFTTNQFNPVPWQGQSPVIALDHGIAKAAVIIPPELTRRIKAGKPSEVQVLIDGSDGNNARVIQNSIKATTNFFVRNSGLHSGTDKVVAHIRFWFNPGRKESLFIVPGVFAIALAIFPAILASIAMVREKEQGTILLVYTSTLSATELLLGKALAYVLIFLGVTIILMFIGSLIWGLGFVGDPTPLLIGTPLFLMSSVLFGLLIGVRASNQSSAIQGAAFGFLPALLLSGFIYPLNNIPFPLSLLSYFVPPRYYIDLTRDAFVRGTGWAGVWYAPLALALLSLLLFNTARRGLGRMQLPD